MRFGISWFCGVAKVERGSGAGHGAKGFGSGNQNLRSLFGAVSMLQPSDEFFFIIIVIFVFKTGSFMLLTIGFCTSVKTSASGHLNNSL